MSDPKTQAATTNPATVGDVSWEECSPPPSRKVDKDGVVYFKVEEGVQHRVRLVRNPYRYLKHYRPVQAVSTGDPATDPVWKAGHKPGVRYCCWVIDRADGMVKLFDFGSRVMEHFHAYAKLQKADPGGLQGPDWTLMETIPDRVNEAGRLVKDYRAAKWMVVCGPPAPFTDADKAAIVAVLSKYKLGDIRNPETPEFLQKLLDEALANPKGPVPGSHEWWKARQGRSGQAMFDQERAAPATAAPATAAPAAGAAAVKPPTGSFEDVFGAAGSTLF